MTTIGLTPSDSSTRHRFRKVRRQGSVCFKVSSSSSLRMMEEEYEPDVNYSVNKRARWRLLKSADNNPASLFDDEPERVQVTVANSTFFHRDVNGSVLLSRKRQHRPNVPSMSHSLEADVRVTFDSRPPRTSVTSIKLPRSSRQRRRLSGFVKDAVEELGEEEEEEEEDEEEEDEVFLPSPSPHSLADFVALPETVPRRPAPPPSVPAEKPVPVFVPDLPAVSVPDLSPVVSSPTPAAPEVEEWRPPRFRVPRGHEDLSSAALRRIFGDAFVDGSGTPRLFAVNLSERLRSRLRLPALPVPRSLHAYAVFEDVGEELEVVLNCGAAGERLDVAANGVEAAVEAAVDLCVRRFPHCLLPPAQARLVVVSGFRVPLDGSLRLQLLPLDDGETVVLTGEEGRRQESVCAVCLDPLADGGFSALPGCGHAFCHVCWTAHLSAEVGRGREELRCAAFDCSDRVDLTTRLRHLPVLSLRSHRLRVIHARLEADPDLVWCPNTLCSRPVHLLGLSRLRDDPGLPLNAYCACGAHFCPDCRLQAHWPASCEAYHAFAEQLRRLGDWEPLWSVDTSQTVSVRTTACPVCRRRWEKNGGCNHMSCPACLTNYCWFCGVRQLSHNEPFPCPKRVHTKNEEAAGNTTIIHTQHDARRPPSPHRSRDYCAALHLRMLATDAASTVRRRRLATELRMTAPVVTAMLRSVAECLRAGEGALVAAMAQTNRERAGILRCFAVRFQQLGEVALMTAGGKDEAVRRIRACREGGRGSARMLQAIISGWRKRQ